MQLKTNITSYKIRTFEKGDEGSLVELFNSMFERYAGFVPRTLEYWDWCCLQRPDVANEGIIVVCNERKIVGYAVVGKSGNIWEFSYDRSENGEEIVTHLLECSLNYIRKVKADSIQINCPMDDRIVRKVCNKLGLAESLPEYMFISVLNFPSLIKTMLVDSNKKRKIDGEYLFKLDSPPSMLDGNFCVTIQGEKATVTRFNEFSNPEILVNTDWSTLISCMLGQTNVLKAIFSLKIRLYPFWKIIKFIRFLVIVKSNSPWFMPRADLG